MSWKQGFQTIYLIGVENLKKKKEQLRDETTNKIILSRPLCNCRVDAKGELSPDSYNGVDTKGELKKPSFSNYLCFTLTIETNDLVYERNQSNYSPRQQEIHDLIKSLHDDGMSYRRISKFLNEKGISTPTGKEWGKTGNSVYSVLKRNRERVHRLENVRKKEHKTKYSKFEVRWDKSQ